MKPLRLFIALVVLVCLLVTSSCSIDGAADDGPEILELSQGVLFASDHPLQVEWVAEPLVLELRRQEKLDAVAAGAASDLELFRRLTSWSRSQFEPGVPDPYPPCNGIAILREIRAGRTGGFCGQYAYLLGDALKSFGYFAVRYVELESQAGAGHFAVEAWSNNLDRWVLLDPLHAALYVRDGIPLSALEIHDELLAGRASTVTVLRLPVPALKEARGAGAVERAAAGSEGDAQLLSVFYNIAVSTRNDFARLDRPLTLDDRGRIFLRYADPRVPPFRNLNFALVTNRREDILMPMNQVAIELEPEPHKGLVHVSFATGGSCPHFMNYRVRLGNRAWDDSGAQLAWAIAPGENTLEVRTVNAYEVLGPVFRVRVRL